MDKPEPVIDFNQEMSVSDVSRLLKGVVETAFARVKIRGEISGVKKSSAGHIYFTLKDDSAVIDAVSWRGQNASFAHFINDGLEVVACGKITVYPMRSNYQIVVDSLVPYGEGALLKLLEERKKKLAEEGLFAPERKKPLPFLPKVIGVVTSPSGAVIRDIINRVSDRFPSHILLWPTAVQGQGAAEEIAAAIKGFNEIKANESSVQRPDVIIVARGGGSIEDLWPFNEEIVVRAAAESEIPLVSAVGHETDFTLIDFAADLRAPTPTGAAEMVVPVRIDLLRRVNQCAARLPDAIVGILDKAEHKIKGLVAGLPDLSGIVDVYVQKLDDKEEKLNFTIRNYMQRVTDKLAHLTRILELCSYQKVLQRGFALVFDKEKHLIDRAEKITQNQDLTLLFADGEVTVASGKKNRGSVISGNKKIKNKKTEMNANKNDVQGELLL